MRLLRRVSLRGRLMLLGVAGLSVGLAVGGAVLFVALGYALQRTADTEAFTTAEAVARLIEENAVPDPLPVAGDRMRVQVVDAQDRVRAASIEADRLVPILYRPERERLGERGATSISGARIGVDGEVRVAVLAVGPPDDRRTVVVAKSMADITRSVGVLRSTLLVAFPLLVAALAAVAWRVVGAALRPVEGLRRGAEAITGGAHRGRLPVPASRDEIHRLAVTLNGMLDRLAAARARQRAFVADAAHELRSPLTNMRTELEVAQRLPDRTDWPALADDLLIDVERLSRLVDDLLLLARADDDARLQRAAEPVELGGLIGAVGARYPSSRVRVAEPAEPLWTVGEPDALARMLGNLVDNAVRHARSEVRLAAEPDGAYHLITVTDDGPGVPAADRERVFDRFTRLDDARARDAGGTGLGLAIVRELVRRHDGTVTLTDAAPTGLRAEVRLPAGPADRPGGVSRVQPAGDVPVRRVQTASVDATESAE